MILACPDQKVLRHFILGQISAVEQDEIASHVESCSECIRRLHELRASDPLLEAAARYIYRNFPDILRLLGL